MEQERAPASGPYTRSTCLPGIAEAICHGKPKASFRNIGTELQADGEMIALTTTLGGSDLDSVTVVAERTTSVGHVPAQALLYMTFTINGWRCGLTLVSFSRKALRASKILLQHQTYMLVSASRAVPYGDNRKGGAFSRT